MTSAMLSLTHLVGSSSGLVQVTGANFRAGESQSLKNVIQAMNDSAAA
jgi:hypothetical protein